MPPREFSLAARDTHTEVYVPANVRRKEYGPADSGGESQFGKPRRVPTRPGEKERERERERESSRGWNVCQTDGRNAINDTRETGISEEREDNPLDLAASRNFVGISLLCGHHSFLLFTRVFARSFHLYWKLILNPRI